MLHDRKMLQSLSVHPGACSDQDNDNEGEQKETTRRQREIINKCLKKTLKFCYLIISLYTGVLSTFSNLKIYSSLL